MTPSNRSAFVSAVLVCTALVATDAQAQFGGGGGGMRRGGGERTGRTADAPAPQQARPQLGDRLDQLGAQLLLTRQQAGSWEAFRRAFMALQQPVGGTVALSDATSAARAMQQKLSLAQDQFTLVEALADALKRLDQELDPQQRAAEDRLLPPLLADFVRTGAGRERPARD